jgi:hypothetical protein
VTVDDSTPIEEGELAKSVLVNHLAQAEAAIMLLESLMIRLLERRIFSAEELLEIVETVVDAKGRMVAEHTHARISSVAAGILKTFANSLAASRAEP